MSLQTCQSKVGRCNLGLPPTCAIHVWNLTVGVDIIQAGIPKQLEVPTSLELCFGGLERAQALRLSLTASRGDNREDLVERAEDGTKFQERRSQKGFKDDTCYTGTDMASDDTHIMFTNTIRNNETDIITRSYINITFGCRYPINYMVQQQNGENLIRVDVRTITLNTEDGNFSVSMLLYKDEEFQDKWTTVPSLTLEDNIYVKVYMIPANLFLRVERCWATPTNDPYSNIQYTLIRNSCPVLWNDETLAVMKNGQGPEALFRIQMFKFVGSSYTDVFLHCNVQICHNTGVCQPNCSAEDASVRTRRDVASSHTVSYGPIRRHKTNMENTNLSSDLPPVETFVLGGLLVILIVITGVFGKLWLQSRNSYPTQEAQLTLSNIHHISEVAS
ncbi:pancreatic secretory granule membrane major glycoprotein GP2-like [Sinocyclocheilus rhinocerous]|uniref:pancreatic secretory granule membrane major glycoprotein GP2-like n=1 Tax=Sinocyclocheilus rhinocerous TaxID=307959 RepID=UPI0007BA064D|nr:PREDICTED: pancreatic secretory granule membrane major glycoprotein GP2-like [Sinocyclocheilus rhinocerous]